MKFNILVLTLLTGSISHFGFSQTRQNAVIKIGDTLPNLTVKNLLKPGKGKTTISDLYRKGGLIINFWATWCSPCIKEIKLLDSIASENPDRFAVLSVTYEAEEPVNSHLKRSGSPKSSNLIVTAGDSLLHQYFPHRSIPHNIWIDHNGVVRAITSGDEISRKNISNFLNKKTSKLYQKDDDLSFDFSKPYHIPDSVIGYRSQISGFNERITSGVNYNNKIGGSTKRYFSWNTRVAELFWMAYCKQLSSRINWNLVELHTSDSIKFFRSRDNRNLLRSYREYRGDLIAYDRRWDQQNLFCYDLILPREVSNDQAAEYMFNDLQRYFNIKAEIEDRRKECRLIYFPTHRAVKADASAKASIELKEGALIVTNQTIDELMLYLYDWFGNEQPYINNTKVSYPINMTITLPALNGKESYSEAEIWEGLKKQGMIYIIKRRPYPVLILRDLN